MNPKSYRTPTSLPARARCPVCHETVYSRSGIHPQCAVRQADPPKPKGPPKVPAQAGPIEPATDPAVAVAPSTPE